MKFKPSVPELSELTLREKIGQTALMQMSWFMNKENLKAYLKENPIGNVWHNGNYNLNTTNLSMAVGAKAEDSEYYRKWALSLYDIMKVPPLIGLDLVTPGFATNVRDIVGASTVGATDSEELAYLYGKIHARAARAVGANYSWSTVVDMPSRFMAVGLMRAMSDKPERLCPMGAAMLRGVSDQGVASTAKHFPGVDDKEYRDGHFSPATLNMSVEKWRTGPGAVFKHMIDAGADSVMVAHIAFPSADDRKFGNAYVPATLSYNVITKLLKEELGFTGVAITDSIDMASLAAIYPDPEDLYVALINAGNDILLNVKRYDYVDIIERAVLDGRISEDRINDACARVLALKKKIFSKEREHIEYDSLIPEINEANKTICERAITLETDVNGLLPLDKKKIKRVAIICSTHREYAFEALHFMKEEFERRGICVHMQRRLRSMEEIEKISAENDLIIYTGYLAPHAPMGASSFYDEECETFFYAFMRGAEKSIGLSFGSVYMYYDFYANSRTFVHGYNLSREAQEAFVKAIFGEIPFSGVMPYRAPGPRKE